MGVDLLKHTYSLALNKGQLVAKPVAATFGNNRAIDLHIRQTGILIEVRTSAVKSPESILYGEDNLFADMTRKALLLYLIRYGKCLDIRSASVQVNGVEQALFTRKAGDPPLVYSLVEGRLRLPFTEAWQNPCVERVIATKSKSAYDGRFVALHALMTAKSDRYEIERFTYYWMAMNALYNYTASLGEPLMPPTSKGKRQDIGNETKKQAFFLRCLQHEPCVLPEGIPKDMRSRHERHLMWSAKAVLKRIPEEEIDDFCAACLAEDSENPWVRQIQQAMRNEKLEYDYPFSVFSFMVIWVPYKLRCASFHGESSLPTFCYQQDAELRVIRVVNRLLDRFLTELVRWMMDDEIAQAECMERVRQAVANPAYGNGRDKA